MKNKADETPSNPIWEFLTSVPLKNLITKYQYLLKLIQTEEKVWDRFKKETVHQFYVGYITHTSLKKHRNHIDQVIRMLQPELK